MRHLGSWLIDSSPGRWDWFIPPSIKHYSERKTIVTSTLAFRFKMKLIGTCAASSTRWANWLQHYLTEGSARSGAPPAPNEASRVPAVVKSSAGHAWRSASVTRVSFVIAYVCASYRDGTAPLSESGALSIPLDKNWSVRAGTKTSWSSKTAHYYLSQ